MSESLPLTSTRTSRPTIRDDAWDTLVLGWPIFWSMLSWVGMKTTDSALLGHVSSEALAAAALSDLWTMCTLVLLQARVLGVLCGAAFGAGNPHLAGVYLQVSYVVLGGVGVLVFGCWYWGTAWVWRESPLAGMAGYYARVLAFSIPGQLFLSQLSQFFASQRILHPEVNASTVALVLNLVLGLWLVLGIPIPHWNGWGFEACPAVTTTVVYIQCFVLWYVYVHRQKLHQPCWPGWKPSEWTRTRIRTFVDLYVPAALGMASDFWRVAVIGLRAAQLGEMHVAVFNTSYRIMWIVLILVNALSSASGIQMTLRLGRLDAKGARQAGEVGIGMSAMVLLVIGVAVVTQIQWFGRVFSNDEEFLGLLSEARWPFTLTLVLMNLSVAIERIPYAMGRTKEVFWMGFIASWGAQVPAVMLCTYFWRDDLVGLYSGMAIGYLVVTCLYAWITFTR